MGKTYRQLIAWQKAMELVTAVYHSTRGFPRDEIYGLTSQMRRAAVSIPSNIAEGQARFSSKDFRNFLGHARGSLAELQTQIHIARNLNYVPVAEARGLYRQANEVAKLLNGLQTAIKGGDNDN